MNVLKKLALVLFVSAFVACSSDDDETNFPSESEIPTSKDDINPETSGEEEGIQEGSFSIVGYWKLTGYIEDGETVTLTEGECGDEVVFDNKGVMTTEFDFNGTDCEETEVAFGAYTRKGNTLNLNFDGEKEVLTIEVTETKLKISGTDDDGAWTDIFEKMIQ